MTDRLDPDAVHTATVATIHGDRVLRHARTYHRAAGRVSAADRNLSELLHPAMAADLTPAQREKLHTARELIRSVKPDLRELAGINPPPPPDDLRKPPPETRLPIHKRIRARATVIDLTTRAPLPQM